MYFTQGVSCEETGESEACTSSSAPLDQNSFFPSAFGFLCFFFITMSLQSYHDWQTPKNTIYSPCTTGTQQTEYVDYYFMVWYLLKDGRVWENKFPSPTSHLVESGTNRPDCPARKLDTAALHLSPPPVVV